MSHKIAFYIRVSTEEQAKNLEGSIRNQKERLFEAVKFKNYSGTFGEVVSVFIDRAKSGKDTNRVELQKMLYEITQGNINLVMVSEISRISRNMKDFSEIWELMKSNNCGFYSLRENFDTTTAAGEMVLYTIANIAQFERRQVSERVAANINARAKRGLYNGGSVPLGFKLNPDKKGYLEHDPEMAKLVRISFNSFLEHSSLSETAIKLNEQGHKIRRWKQGGGRFKRLSHFTTDNLHKILKNKAYIGVKVFTENGVQKETKAVWQPIVSKALFNQVNKKLRNNIGKKPFTKTRYPYLLSGITYCMKCKNVMCGKSAHGNSGKVGYYEHSWATKRESTLTKKTFKCSPHRVLAKKLEPLVLDEVQKLIFDESMVKRLFTGIKAVHEVNSNQKELNSIKARIYGINSQLSALTERLSELPSKVSAAPIYKQMEMLEARKNELNLSLEDVLSQDSKIHYQANFEDYSRFLRSLRQAWLTASSETKSKIIKQLVCRIEVGEESVIIHYNVDSRILPVKTKKPSVKEGFFKKSSNIFELEGSNCLTNGARERT